MIYQFLYLIVLLTVYAQSSKCISSDGSHPIGVRCEDLVEYDECDLPCIWTGNVPPMPPTSPPQHNQGDLK